MMERMRIQDAGASVRPLLRLLVVAFACTSSLLLLSCSGNSSANPDTTASSDDGVVEWSSPPASPDVSVLVDPNEPLYMDSGDLSPDAEDILTLASLQLSLEGYRAAYGQYPADLNDLLTTGFPPIGKDGKPMTSLPVTSSGEPLSYVVAANQSSYRLSTVMTNGTDYSVTGGPS